MCVKSGRVHFQLKCYLEITRPPGVCSHPHDCENQTEESTDAGQRSREGFRVDYVLSGVLEPLFFIETFALSLPLLVDSRRARAGVHCWPAQPDFVL